jgi:hypothetical protein
MKQKKEKSEKRAKEGLAKKERKKWEPRIICKAKVWPEMKQLR